MRGASCSISSLVVRQGTGCHPRHPPRAFPLGLLAPRCLGAVLFLASAPCSALARAPLHLGGERNPPPSVGLLLAVVCESIQCFIAFIFYFCFVASLFVPSESALAQPPFTFSYRSLVVSLPLLNFCIAIQRRRSSVALDALAEMPEAQIHICLPHTTHAHTSRPRRTGGIAGVAPCEIPKHKSPRQWRGLLLISTDLLARVPEVILAEERCLEERDFAHSPFAQIGGDHSHCYPIRFRYPN